MAYQLLDAKIELRCDVCLRPVTAHHLNREGIKGWQFNRYLDKNDYRFHSLVCSSYCRSKYEKANPKLAFEREDEVLEFTVGIAVRISGEMPDS